MNLLSLRILELRNQQILYLLIIYGNVIIILNIKFVTYKQQDKMTTISHSDSRSFKIRKTGYRTKTFQQLQDQEEVMNLQDLRLAENTQHDQPKQQNTEKNIQEPAIYLDDEQNINCYRFPHSTFCGCNPNCLLESFEPFEMVNRLYVGNFITGLKSKHLIDLGITHILNVTCKQYTKRNKYFQYQNIDLLNTTEQDAKKFFRLSNRFIRRALESGGKVLIHTSVDQIGATMACAYMIGILKISLKQCLSKIAEHQIQINPHFLKQLEAYDLQKMAFVSIQRQ